MSLSKEEIERAKFTFSIYDFDGSEKIDAFQLGNALRAMGLNPSLKKISNLGGTIRRNERSLTVEEFLGIYEQAKKDKDEGTMEDYLECLKSHDKDSSGKLSVAQLGHLLQAYGEKLDRDEVEEIIKDCGNPYEDLVDYKSFLKNLLQGPENRAVSPVRETRRERKQSSANTVAQQDLEQPAETTTPKVETNGPTSPTPPVKDIAPPTTQGRRASSEIDSTTDTSTGKVPKGLKSLKPSKSKSQVAPEKKVEPPPVKAKFQQPLISLKTDGLFGKRA